MIIKLKTHSFLFSLILFLLISCDFNKEDVEKSSFVNISGYIENVARLDSIPFSRFVNSDPSNYFFMFDESTIENGLFQKKFKLDRTGIITIGPNAYVPKIYLICNPGDSIQIKINGRNISFKGDNAEGHKLFHSRNRGGVLDGIIDKDVISKATNSEEAIRIINDKKEESINGYKQLLKKEKIASSFFSLAKAQIEADYITSTYDVINHHINNTNDKDSIALSEKELKKTLKNIFETTDPFSEKYKDIDMLSREIIGHKKGKLIEQGLLTEGTKNDLGLWDDRLKSNSYAPIELQEKMKAINIMFNRHFGVTDISKDQKEYNLFKKVFPNSPYIAPLKRYFENNENSEVSAYTLVRYLKSNQKLEIEKTHDNANVSELIKKEFKGKAVFVDVWATWCSPCLNEFGYSKPLVDFLDKNQIEILYVSVDNENAGKQWEKAIVRYNLKGAHFLATKALYPFLAKDSNKNIPIPKYLLFDKNGELLDSDLPRPSTGKKLIERIEVLLK